MMVDIRGYLDRGGRSPFGEWRGKLNPEARRKVTTALYRVGLGTFLTSRVSALVFLSARSISARATERTLEKPASKW